MENITIEDIKNLIHSETSTSKTMGKIIAGGVTIITGCAMVILTFIWDMKSEIPLLKKSISDANDSYGTLQNSINSMRLDQQTQRDNQIRIEEHVKNIEQSLDNRK